MKSMNAYDSFDFMFNLTKYIRGSKLKSAVTWWHYYYYYYCKSYSKYTHKHTI